MAKATKGGKRKAMPYTEMMASHEKSEGGKGGKGGKCK